MPRFDAEAAGSPFRAARSAIPGAVIALLIASCGGTSRPAELKAAECGDSAAPGSVAALPRWPYVQWVTETGAVVAWGTGIDTKQGQLRYGRDTSYVSAVDADVKLLSIGEGSTLHLFSASLSDLEPNTEYCYQVRAAGAELAGGLKFHTAPKEMNATVRFLVMGDYGSGSLPQVMVRDQMLDYLDRTDLILTTGDNAYSAGAYVEFQKKVFEIYPSLFARIPVFPSIGNHDFASSAAQPYLDNFFLPENAWRETDRERYYSFDWGPLHVTVLDSEYALYGIRDEETDDMVDWLEADLSTTNRPWKIVTFHQPGHTNNPKRSPNPIVVLKIVPVLEKFRVPLVLSGHEHFYERFHPILKGQRATTSEGGVTYLTSGGGGASLYDINLGTDPLQAFGMKIHHFLAGGADDCTLSARAIDFTGQEIDRFSLTRC
ncbi:MAG: metallophosphoesterase family protein [Nitrospirae bacterium]|nr:metallophosphoesterase family protein [Nitrospirota bacterium]